MDKLRAITQEDVPRLIKTQRIIQRTAKKQGIPMTSGEAKKLAMRQLGLMGEREFKKFKHERALEDTFAEGMRSAMPRYRNL